MTNSLEELSARYGIEESYISAEGEYRRVPDEIKLGLLDAMGIDTIGLAPPPLAEKIWPTSNAGLRPKCYIPHWLRGHRAWGVATQLYALSSQRNQGIGDFEDLARLAELAAARGADFVGVNPLHALFSNDPDRCSPYFPSTRQFLNPLYIAIDKLPGGEKLLEREDGAFLNELRASAEIDYSAVAKLKLRLMRDVFEQQYSSQDAAAFEKFCAERAEPLDDFARFEALGARMMPAGFGAGWRDWPQELQNSRSDAVADVLGSEGRTILWHKWMQWCAHEQLIAAHERAKKAGMRIGLYLDIAVGVAPDGAATWSDPALVTTKARIGCPPDFFNPMGQDWGLAPIIPSQLRDRDLNPFADVIRASAQYAGAVRMDHAMALERLYWIPDGRDACEGGYVRYPSEELLDVLSSVSQEQQTIIIGEDLGTVPEDFRGKMRAREIPSYRVFYFERGNDGHFTQPEDYPELALACVGTHDLPTMAGWWNGSDIDTRSRLGLISLETADVERIGRQQSRKQLLALLQSQGVEISQEDFAADWPSDAVVAGLHACIASGRSWLFVVQLEDLAAARVQTNIPGTHKEYPNWRTRMPMNLEEVFASPLAMRTLDAVARVRARHP